MLEARRVVMSSVLYYGLDRPVLSDAAYEQDCKAVIAGWDNLSPLLRWQLGGPEIIGATGFLIKATVASVHGACAWVGLQCVPTAPWQVSKKFNTRWLPVGSFRPAG